MSDVYGYIYASTVLTAGFWEYYKTKSFCLFAVDLVCGGALVCGAYLVSGDPRNYTLQLVSSLLVAGVMAYRYFSSDRRLLPILVFILSVIMIIQTGAFLIIRDITLAFAQILKPNDDERKG